MRMLLTNSTDRSLHSDIHHELTPPPPHLASTGFVTLLNSKHMNLPPGFSTLRASWRAWKQCLHHPCKIKHHFSYLFINHQLRLTRLWSLYALFYICSFQVVRYQCRKQEVKWSGFSDETHGSSCVCRLLTHLIYVSDVANAEGDGVNVELVVIKGQLLCVAHHPRQAWWSTHTHTLRDSVTEIPVCELLAVSSSCTRYCELCVLFSLMHGCTEMTDKLLIICSRVSTSPVRAAISMQRWLCEHIQLISMQSVELNLCSCTELTSLRNNR